MGESETRSWDCPNCGAGMDYDVIRDECICRVHGRFRWTPNGYREAIMPPMLRRGLKRFRIYRGREAWMMWDRVTGILYAAKTVRALSNFDDPALCKPVSHG